MASAEPAYLDSSALFKLVVDEDESAPLRSWTDSRTLVSSEIAIVEVSRGVRRVGRADRFDDLIGALVERVSLAPVSRDLLRSAAAIESPHLRALDAIHIATASLLAAEAIFVTYDHRQFEAAEAVGLQVLAPA